MRSKQPLKEVLIKARDLWQHAGVRGSVRENFNKVSACRTAALGAECMHLERKRKSFSTPVSRDRVPVAGIGPPFCGSGSSGPLFLMSLTEVLS